MPNDRDALADPFHDVRMREQLSFSGDGDRMRDSDGPPTDADPPVTRGNAQTLRASGTTATRKILRAAALASYAASSAGITDEALAEQLIRGMKRFDGKPSELTSGLHAKHHLRARSTVEQWQVAWDRGHTASPAWHNPVARSGPRAHGAAIFTLRPRVKASEGLAQWLAGFTVADRTSALTAIHLDVVCTVAGAEAFDACFGGAGAPGAMGNLVLSSQLAHTPLEPLLRFTDPGANAKKPGELGKRPVLPGESYYFANAPAYRYKHPAGEWRGERCVYLGDEGGQQMWSGFGTCGTEEDILRELVARYNAPRDDADRAWLQAFFADEPASAGHALADSRDEPLGVDALQPFGLDLSTGLALNARAIAELMASYA